MIKPVLKLPYVAELSYYAGAVLQFFMIDAVIMRSIYVLKKKELEDAYKLNSKDVSFFYEDFINTASELSYILQFETTFFKPCRSSDEQLADVLFRYVCQDYFTRIENLMTAEEAWGHRVARHLEDFGSEDDYDDDYDDYDDENSFEDDYSQSAPLPNTQNGGEEYKINHNHNPLILSDIFFYKNILNAIIEAYLISAENLQTLVGQQITDSAYYRDLLSKMLLMFNEKRIVYAESMSLDTLKNSMNLFISMGVVENHTVDNIEVFYLSNDYNSEDQLQKIVNKIKKFY